MSTPENRWISLFVFLLSLYWSYQLLFVKTPWIFLDGINLLFHEAGHLLLMPGPEFVMMLGGTIFQLLLPSLVLVQFWRSQQTFGASFCVWWIGDNLINIGWYMADAQEMWLETIGPGHDWNWLFGQLGLLHYDNFLGGSIILLGKGSVILGLIAMAYFLQHLWTQNPAT